MEIQTVFKGIMTDWVLDVLDIRIHFNVVFFTCVFTCSKKDNAIIVLIDYQTYKDLNISALAFKT